MSGAACSCTARGPVLILACRPARADECHQRGRNRGHPGGGPDCGHRACRGDVSWRQFGPPGGDVRHGGNHADQHGRIRLPRLQDRRRTRRLPPRPRPYSSCRPPPSRCSRRQADTNGRGAALTFLRPHAPATGGAQSRPGTSFLQALVAARAETARSGAISSARTSALISSGRGWVRYRGVAPIGGCTCFLPGSLMSAGLKNTSHTADDGPEGVRMARHHMYIRTGLQMVEIRAPPAASTSRLEDAVRWATHEGPRLRTSPVRGQRRRGWRQALPVPGAPDRGCSRAGSRADGLFTDTAGNPGYVDHQAQQALVTSPTWVGVRLRPRASKTPDGAVEVAATLR